MRAKRICSFVTQVIVCDKCLERLKRKLHSKETNFYVGQPHRYYGQHNARIFSGVYVEGEEYEEILSIMIKAVVCHPVTVAIIDGEGVKEMIIQPLEANYEKKL